MAFLALWVTSVASSPATALLHSHHKQRPAKEGPRSATSRHTYGWTVGSGTGGIFPVPRNMDGPDSSRMPTAKSTQRMHFETQCHKLLSFRFFNHNVFYGIAGYFCCLTPICYGHFWWDQINWTSIVSTFKRDPQVPNTVGGLLKNTGIDHVGSLDRKQTDQREWYYSVFIHLMAKWKEISRSSEC